MRRKQGTSRQRKPKVHIGGVQHYQVRIKDGTPIANRNWQSIGVMPEGKLGTVTGVISRTQGLEGLTGFLRVIWDGYPNQATLVNPIHVERIQEAA